ncbi:unnamed protein product [Prorocentrum cordatum]|uniref:Dynactin subunit 5 n=1 Tax=Prorocentrum cordatum TaxID=2364126 RepID=A0ABN9TEK1_9DINO|nr:unnamed protein product [Polarella glacialis]
MAESAAAAAVDLGHALDFEGPPVYYNKADYIQTASGNKVSRQSILCGSQNISLAGKSIVKPGVVLRGDLQLLRIGKFVIIGEGSVLRPSYKKYKGNFSFFPMTVGDHVTIGARSIISAAQIGSCVSIGEDCVISKRCMVKENSVVLPGTVLPPDTVVPPLTVFGGHPGQYLGDLPESTAALQKQQAASIYRRFQADPTARKAPAAAAAKPPAARPAPAAEGAAA